MLENIFLGNMLVERQFRKSNDKINIQGCCLWWKEIRKCDETKQPLTTLHNVGKNPRSAASAERMEQLDEDVRAEVDGPVKGHFFHPFMPPTFGAILMKF